MKISKIYSNEKKYPNIKKIKTCLIEKTKFGYIIYPIFPENIKENKKNDKNKEEIENENTN